MSKTFPPADPMLPNKLKRKMTINKGLNWKLKKLTLTIKDFKQRYEISITTYQRPRKKTKDLRESIAISKTYVVTRYV